MSPQKFEIIRRFESGESRSVVVALYNLGSWSLRYKEAEGPVSIVHGIRRKSEGPFKAADIEMA
jgi:hypothetical protein